jgi:hypothetical protein
LQQCTAGAALVQPGANLAACFNHLHAQ